MKHYAAGVRLITVICVLTVLFMMGCGANKSQNEVKDNITALQDKKAEDSILHKEADIVAVTSTPSGIGLEKQESDSVLQERELITDAATLQAVIDIVENSTDQIVFEYADFTVEEFLAEIASVYQNAHDNRYSYGDSQTMPPCEDGIISCDRMIARALWNLGLTDQPNKGMNVGNEAKYLTTHGFELVTKQSQLKSGDIVLQDNGVSGIPNWRWHTFVLVSYDPETTICEKYDCGHFTPDGKDRISSEQPFKCPLADYGCQRRFVCGFRLKQKLAG